MASKTFGIDFGTSKIKIYKKGEGIILNERNILAIENKKNIIAVGNEAFEMFERAPVNINVSYPVRSGVIADLANMQSLLNHIFKALVGFNIGFGSNDFVLAVPTDITEVEKRAFYDLVASSNTKARKISIVEKPIADALGAGLDITHASGVMIVNIGADTTEISIMSLGGMVLSKLVPIGGNKLDDSIKAYVRKRYNLIIGSKTSETIKKQLASACKIEEEVMQVCGRNVVTGLPAQMDISSAMVYDSIHEYLNTIVDSIRIILERTPPEISSDIIESGLYVTGGSANIRNLDKLISSQTDLKVNICKNSSSTVIEGLGRIMEEADFNSLATSTKLQSYSTKMGS